ncbi:DDE-type integrase/transposase/recombinase [Paenibacillus larvae]|nr:hypothetical protein B5S25_17330 [Paenibacillus larvae subsp. pulvifaciens]
MSIIDVFDRVIITYHHGLSCEARDLVQITQEALMKRQLFDKANKPVIRSDNGPQFISHKFAQACERFEIVHERIPQQECSYRVFSCHSRDRVLSASRI